MSGVTPRMAVSVFLGGVLSSPTAEIGAYDAYRESLRSPSLGLIYKGAKRRSWRIVGS